MQGFACLVTFNPYLIKTKTTTGVKVRAQSVILMHSNKVLQLTGKSKTQILYKYR